jgi:hypothetical protein
MSLWTARIVLLIPGLSFLSHVDLRLYVDVQKSDDFLLGSCWSSRPLIRALDGDLRYVGFVSFLKSLR